MRHSSRGWPRAVAAVAMALASATAAGAAQAGSFAAVHDRARELARQKQSAEAAKVYGTFAATHARDELAPLASILQGIVLRRDLDQGEAARAAFKRAAMAPDTPLGRQLKHVARAWLARVQMEAIDKALREHYVKHVWYPEGLDELAAGKSLADRDLVDPWGKPFGYKAGRLKWAPKVPRQKYTLTCSAIEADSRALRGVLKRATEFERRVQLRSIVPASPLKAIVATADEPNRRVSVTAGSKIGSATVAAITEGGVLLVDGEFAAFLTAVKR